MTSKTLSILTAVTAAAVIIVAAFFLIEQQNGIPGRGDLLFPDLMPKINEVREISVKTKDQTATVGHAGEFWTVNEQSGYRAAMDKVRMLIIGLAELRIVEPKTQNVELYHKLGLEDVEAAGSTSALVSLKGEAGTVLARLIVGKRRLAKGNSSRQEFYVRKPDHPQTWLAIGRLELELSSDAWIDKQITNIDTQRIRQVRVMHQRGHTVTIRKDTPADTDYSLVPPPTRGKVRSQFTINNIADTAAHLTLDEVRPATEVRLPARGGVKAVLETFDGLRVTLRTVKTEGKNYVTASAAFDEQLVQRPDDESTQAGEEAEGKPKTPEKPTVLNSAEDVQREAKDLNERLSGWAFVIPQFRADNIAKRRRDLIS